MTYSDTVLKSLCKQLAHPLPRKREIGKMHSITDTYVKMMTHMFLKIL